MTNLIPKLSYIFGRHDRLRLVLLMVMMFLRAGAEALSLGMLVPLIYILTSPQDWMNQPVISTIYRAVGSPPVLDFTLWIIAAVGFIFVVRSGFVIFVTAQQSHFVADKHIELAHRLFKGYMRAPYHFHFQRNSAHLLNTLHNELNRFSGLLHSILSFCAEFIVIVILVVLLVTADPLSFVISVLILGVSVSIFYQFFRKKLVATGNRRLNADKMRMQWIQQGLHGIKEIKVLGREQFFLNNFDEHQRESSRLESFVRILLNSSRPFYETILVLSAISILGIVMAYGYSFVTILPTLVLFVGAAYRLVPSLNIASSTMTAILTNLPSIDTIYYDLQFLEGRAEQGDKSFDISVPQQQQDKPLSVSGEVPTVDLVGVCYRYPTSDCDAVHNITLSIPADTTVGIIGPSGSGKTTLIDVILGLLPPTSGKVLANGVDIHAQLDVWQQYIGYIPQTIYLADGTVRANVALGIPATQIDDEQVWAVLRIAQLDQFVQALPDGLSTVIGEHGVRLSGGQRQRIGIARALYHNPAILVMDEATSALDNETERSFMKAIESLRSTKTIIIIAHRLTTVKDCDVLYVLKNGAIEEVGTYDSLMLDSQQFRIHTGEDRLHDTLDALIVQPERGEM